jgi:hypothetical protein
MLKSLKKNICLFITFNLFFTQSFAFSPGAVEAKEYTVESESISSIDNQEKIERIFNSYRYKMSVVFDSNNESFQAQAKQELELDLMQLEAQGVSANEIQRYVESNILSHTAKVEYQKLLETLEKQGRSEEEASQIAMKFAENNGRRPFFFWIKIKDLEKNCYYSRDCNCWSVNFYHY